MDTKGKFIVFEGTDGSGKSTQMKMLFKYLAGRGVSCFCTREPTDSPFGALLRSCLTGRVEADEHTIAAMFAADRLDHINNGVNGIKKSFPKGKPFSATGIIILRSPITAGSFRSIGWRSLTAPQWKRSARTS